MFVESQKSKIPFDPTLFNNTKYIRSSKHLAVAVGDFFEEATAKMFNFNRLCINSTQQACPDLVNEKKSIYLESKASSLKNGVVIKKEQLQHYNDFKNCHFPTLNTENPVFDIDIKYCLWFYEADLNHKDPDVIKERLSQNITHCYFVGIDIINSLMTENIQYCKRLKHKALQELYPAHFSRSIYKCLRVYNNQQTDLNLR
jgi:hypothetical protein